MASGRRVNRVSHRQLEILWEFLTSNREIACAYNRSLQAKEQSKRKWREIADILIVTAVAAIKISGGLRRLNVGYSTSAAPESSD